MKAMKMWRRNNGSLAAANGGENGNGNESVAKGGISMAKAKIMAYQRNNGGIEEMRLS
jgi:hypothetical protein